MKIFDMIIWDSDFEFFVKKKKKKKKKNIKRIGEVYGHLVRNLGFFG